jgi:hypothetical protein
MKTDIEYAALVMGDAVQYKEVIRSRIAEFGLIKHTKRKGFYVGVRPFDPEHDDGDSRRLEIACLRWMMDCESVVPPNVWRLASRLDGARITGGADEYRAAVLLLAVAIGKTIEGKDNG